MNCRERTAEDDGADAIARSTQRPLRGQEPATPKSPLWEDEDAPEEIAAAAGLGFPSAHIAALAGHRGGRRVVDPKLEPGAGANARRRLPQVQSRHQYQVADHRL